MCHGDMLFISGINGEEIVGTFHDKKLKKNKSTRVQNRKCN